MAIVSKKSPATPTAPALQPPIETVLEPLQRSAGPAAAQGELRESVEKGLA